MTDTELDNNEIIMFKKLDGEIEKNSNNNQKKLAKDLNDSFKKELEAFKSTLDELGINFDIDEISQEQEEKENNRDEDGRG